MKWAPRITRRALAGGLTLLPFGGRAAAQTPATPRSSQFVDHPEASAALSLLQAKRWQDLSALVRSLGPDSAVVLLGDVTDLADVDSDVAGLGDVPMGHTMLGAFYVNWAWAYRGTGVGSTVVGDRLQAFVDRLGRARESLERAIDSDANDGVAYTFLIRTLQGQNAVPALDSLWGDFERVERQRKPIRAFVAMEDVLSAKWFGSDELMLGFARAQQRALEPASQALVCQVANEMLIARLRRGGVEDAVNFAAQEGVLGEVGAASDAYLALPAPEDFYQANFANSQFSFFFAFLGLADHSRPYLQAMDRRLASPWTLFEEEAFNMLDRARIAAGLEST